MATSSTIQAASYTCIRHAPIPSARIPYQQKKEKTEQREKTQAEIDEAVEEWFASTRATANRLAERFNKKPRYFLDIFFHGGAHMLTHHEKVNPHNAFMSVKAKELRDEGSKMNLLSMQQAYKEEYEAMSPQQLEKVVEDFKENIQSSTHIQRPSPRGRVQDVNNIVRNIRMLVTGLRERVGVEGFFCLVRSTSDYYMEPTWWDTKEVGLKLEAFAIAGCDPINLFSSSKKKADYLKGAIRDKVSAALVAITGNPKATMNYARFEEEIVFRYGIILEGWTYEKFANPSELSSSIPGLTKLHNALESGACRFVKLSPEEKKARMKKYQEKLTTGEIQPFQRKRWCDAGLRREGNKKAKTTQHEDTGNSGEDVNIPKSAEFVENEGE